MSQFMIAYCGGNQPSSEEEGKANKAEFMQWIEGIGENMISPGNPLMNSKIITSTSVTEDTDKNSMHGFSVIQAEDMQAAIEIAKLCPFLKTGGTLRVSEITNMQSSC